MKKIFSSVIISAFAVSLFAFPSATNAFLDVPSDSAYAPAVKWLEETKAVYPGRYFNPDQLITRAEFSKMAILSAGISNPGFPQNAPASDVAQQIWFSPYVAKMIQWQALNIESDGLFHPNATVTKAEAIKAGMIIWGIGVPHKIKDVETKFADVRADAWFAPYIYRANDLSLLEKNESNTVQPLKRLTRAEAAKLLYDFQSVAGNDLGQPAAEVPTINVEFTTNSGNDYIDLLNSVWQTVESDYMYPEKVKDEKLGYGAISGLVQALDDPYSEFVPPSESEEFSMELEGKVTGIGAHVDMQDNQLVIVTPVPDSPAEKAGLQPHDIIIKVDDVDIAGMPKADSVKKIRGAVGTSVKITIRRPSTGQTLDFNIIRALIDEKTVTLNVKPDNLALIRITQFTGDTLSEFQSVLTEMKGKMGTPRGIILDMRNNPGGYLESSLQIASYFMKKGEIITSTRDKYGSKHDYVVDKDGELLGIPLVILVNDGSASAAEIVTGALSGNKHARVVGEKTYGKGTAQSVRGFDDGSILKITVAEWLLPNGGSINKNGIVPDVQIKNDEKTEAVDEQLNRAIQECLTYFPR
ncbi:MAG: S41 family peptidase [Patescibacteria group bacterium]|nr:S41 family peptidase [Patescibacteria group bacterium]